MWHANYAGTPSNLNELLMANDPTTDDKLLWYKDAIIYELHIKAFCDANGDGIGDFQGLMTKLDYLFFDIEKIIYSIN